MPDSAAQAPSPEALATRPSGRQHEAVDVAMVTVELPAPGLSAGWLAEKADPVKKLAEFHGQSGQLGELLVELHRFACRFIGAHAQAGAQNAKSELALLFDKLDEAEPVAHQIAMNIAPGPPDLAIDVKCSAARWRGRAQPGTHARHRSSVQRSARLAQWKQSAFEFTIRGRCP